MFRTTREEGINRILAMCNKRERYVEKNVDDWEGSVIALFRKAGIDARITRVSLSELACLSRPCMLRVSDDEWVVAGEKTDIEGLGRRIQWIDELVIEVIGQYTWEGDGYLKRMGRTVLTKTTELHMALAMILVMQGMALLVPQAAKLVMRRAMPNGAIGWLAFASLAVLMVGLLTSGIGILKTRASVAFGSWCLASLQRGMIGHILRMPFVRTSSLGMSEILLVTQSQDLTNKVLNTGFLLLTNALIVGGNLIIMGLSMPAVTAAFILLSLVTMLVGTLVGLLQIKGSKQYLGAKMATRAVLGEMINGVATLRACSASDRIMDRWKFLLFRELDLGVSIATLGARLALVTGVLQRSMFALIIVWGGYAALQGEADAGSLVAFAMMAATVSVAINDVTSAVLSLAGEWPSIRKIDGIINVGSEHTARMATSNGPIVARDVWFRYHPEERWILKGFEMKVEPRECVWLKCPTGSGKSTLLRILSGLMAPERGSVLVAGDPVYGSGMPIGYLPQSVKMFDDSILNNLRLLSGGAPRERIISICERTGLDALVKTLPLQYMTRASSTTLPGGQGQLLMLSAILASDCGILLLDEPMSSMDWVMRSRISQVIRELEKTVIYVSHDIPIGEGDRILQIG